MEFKLDYLDLPDPIFHHVLDVLATAPLSPQIDEIVERVRPVVGRYFDPDDVELFIAAISGGLAGYGAQPVLDDLPDCSIACAILEEIRHNGKLVVTVEPGDRVHAAVICLATMGLIGFARNGNELRITRGKQR